VGDYVENKGTTALQTPKSVNCSYGINFKLMLIRHAEETNSCTAVWKIWNRMYSALENENMYY
jgi:hypothetical protein